MGAIWVNWTSVDLTGLSNGQWGSMDIPGGQWESLEVSSTQWRFLGINGGHWDSVGSLGFSGAQWGSLEPRANMSLMGIIWDQWSSVCLIGT